MLPHPGRPQLRDQVLPVGPSQIVEGRGVLVLGVVPGAPPGSPAEFAEHVKAVFEVPPKVVDGWVPDHLEELEEDECLGRPELVRRGVCGSHVGRPLCHPLVEGLLAVVDHRLDLGEYLASDALEVVSPLSP